MKKFLSAAFGAYRKYRAFTKRSKTYKAVKYSLVKVFAAYGNFTLPFRLCMQRAAEQVVIQTRCSVYNVHVSKKREQEGMKVGNDFGSTPLKPNPSNSVICFSPSSVSRCGTFDPE